MPSATRLAPFFGWTFLFTFVPQAPAALCRSGLLPGDADAFLPIAGLGSFGPLFAGMVVARSEGRTLRSLFTPLATSSAGPFDHVFALVLPGILLAAGLGLASLLGAPVRRFVFPPEDAGRVAAVVLIPFAEELGFRGIALPRLEARFGLPRASLVLGVAWALWHFPIFLATGMPSRGYALAFPFFVGGSVVFSWLMHRRGGGLRMALLAHAGAHLSNSHASLPDDLLPSTVHAVGFALLATVVGPRLVRTDRPDST